MLPKDKPKTCKVAGCAGLVLGHSYCTKHYQRWKKYGDPLFTKIKRKYG